MAIQDPAELCPDERLREALSAIEDNPTQALSSLPRLVDEFPTDPRLRFLTGSMLASAGRYNEARSEMRSALRIAPDYAIARFQLGLLELSSGEATAAETTWRALDDLPSDHPLRVMSAGLRSLARDQFVDAITQLERGIALNTEHPPINHDMGMLITAIRTHIEKEGPSSDTSATHMLLQQYKGGPTRH